MKIQLNYQSGISITYDLPSKVEENEDFVFEKESILASGDYISSEEVEQNLLALEKVKELVEDQYTQTIGLLKVLMIKHEPNPRLVDTLITEIYKLQELGDPEQLENIKLITED